MKFVPALGLSLAGVALLAGASSAQDAGKPKAQNPPQPQAAATAPQQNGGQPADPAGAPQEAEKPKPKERVDAQGNPITVDADAALTARYAKAAAPGEEHQWLANFAGKWKTVTTQHIKPGSPPVESSGNSEFKMLMDGRFLVESNSSSGGPGPSTGMGVIGFNNMTGKYERVWFDTRSTAIMKSEGEYNKERDEIRWVDQWCDPGSGTVTTTNSSLLRSKDGKAFSFTQLVTKPNNEQFVALSIKYGKGE